uniref:DUF4160 domain-containing protein n=1 Tax=Steinernema glaseri TaxID=37863 RepID=A0A1I7ZKF2_9BILA
MNEKEKGGRGKVCLPIAHVKGTTFLEVRKSRDSFEMQIKYKFYTKERLESLISDWKKGNGETLGNGLKKKQVEIAQYWNRNWPVTPQHSHPLGNTRCLIVEKDVCRGCSMERISIVPIDPEDVEDWHLELLFGSLQV